MSIDAFRIEPVSPVRARGTPMGAPQASPQAPFSAVLAQTESAHTTPSEPHDRSTETTAADQTSVQRAQTDRDCPEETSDAHTPQRVNSEDGTPGRHGQGLALGHTKPHPAQADRSAQPSTRPAHAADAGQAGAETPGVAAPDLAAKDTLAQAQEAVEAKPATTDAAEATAPVVTSDATPLAQATPVTEAVQAQRAMLLGEKDAPIADSVTDEGAALAEGANGTQERVSPAHPRSAGQHASASASASASDTETAQRPNASRIASDAAAALKTPSDARQSTEGAAQINLPAGLERQADQPAAAPSASAFGQTLRAMLSGAESPPPAAAPAPSFPITVPFGTPKFGAAFGERVSWMVREGLQNAELTLNPPDLGPIRIALSMDQDAATFGFNATHAQTRAAIEQALPRLRELLAEQGLSLGHTTIDAGTGRQGESWGGTQAGSGRASIARGSNDGTPQDAADGTPGGLAPRARVVGRIDLFA